MFITSLLVCSSQTETERERSQTHPNGRTLGSGNGRPREDGVARLGSGVVALP